MPFSEDSFHNFIVENRVVGFFDEPVKLSSGRLSHWYVNWRSVTEDAYLADRLTDYVVDFITDLPEKPRCIYGVPEGASKTAVLAMYKWASRSADFGPGSHILPMGRGKTKEHGAEKDRHFLGMPAGETIVVEDVSTTGSSLMRTLDQLVKLDVQVVAALCLTNRMETLGGGKNVESTIKEKYGIPFHAMSRADVLLPLAAKQLNPPASVMEAVRVELAEHGIPVKW